MSEPIRLTMRGVCLLLGDGPASTPVLLALFDAGVRHRLRRTDDVTDLAGAFGAAVLAGMRGSEPVEGPDPGLVSVGARSGGDGVRVRVGPDSLTTAAAFLRDPTHATLSADRVAYDRLRAHMDRLAEKL